MAASGEPGTPRPPDPRAGAGQASGSCRVTTRLRPENVAINSRVMEAYGSQMGALSGWTYAGLCYWASWQQRAVWMSYTKLAKLLGISRSSVVRSIRHLCTLRLIECSPNYEERRQTTNTITLLDPFSGEANAPTPVDLSERVSNGQGGAVNLIAPPCPLDSAPLSIRDPRPIQDPIEDLPLKGGSAPAPSAPNSDPENEVARLFAHLFVGGTPVQREQVYTEAADHARELLRRGYTLEQIALDLADPVRDRDEWPRTWARRMKREKRPAKPLRPAKAVPNPPVPGEVENVGPLPATQRLSKEEIEAIVKGRLRGNGKGPAPR